MILLTTRHLKKHLSELSACGLDYCLVAGWVNSAYQLYVQTVYRDGERSDEDIALIVMSDRTTPRRMKLKPTVERYAERHGLDLNKVVYQEDCP